MENSPNPIDRQETALDHNDRKRTARVHGLCTAFAICLGSLMPGCVYHRRNGQASWYEYDHNDAMVVFPWRIDHHLLEYGKGETINQAMDKEYELAILSSILIWTFAWLREVPEAIGEFDKHPDHIFTAFAPALPRAYENDREHIRQKILAARDSRLKNEQEEKRD